MPVAVQILQNVEAMLVFKVKSNFRWKNWNNSFCLAFFRLIIMIFSIMAILMVIILMIILKIFILIFIISIIIIMYIIIMIYYNLLYV